VIEATSTGGRWSDFFTAEKLAAGNLGLLQQYLPGADSCSAANSFVIRSTGLSSLSAAFVSFQFGDRLDLRLAATDQK
jgi:hypothetical protein